MRSLKSWKSSVKASFYKERINIHCLVRVINSSDCVMEAEIIFIISRSKFMIPTVVNSNNVIAYLLKFGVFLSVLVKSCMLHLKKKQQKNPAKNQPTSVFMKRKCFYLLKLQEERFYGSCNPGWMPKDNLRCPNVYYFVNLILGAWIMDFDS